MAANICVGLMWQITYHNVYWHLAVSVERPSDRSKRRLRELARSIWMASPTSTICSYRAREMISQRTPLKGLENQKLIIKVLLKSG